ncbi:NAD(P)-dependent oxidoreductase [Sulfitobacter sp. LCG007]
MTSTLIFSTHPLPAPLREALEGLGRLRIASAPRRGAIVSESHGAGIILGLAPVPADVVTNEPALRAIFPLGAGATKIPLDLATSAGVLVSCVPAENAESVAEHVIWSALALLRQYPRVEQDLRLLGWDEGRAHADQGRELSGKTVGIVGMGDIGKAVARIARHGFGMSVVYDTQRPGPEVDGIAALSLDALLSQSDVVVICCSPKPHLHGLIHAGRIAKMKRGAILVNVSKGPMVVEHALVKALREGRLGGAALDVHHREPLPRTHAFFGLPNLILTPRVAGRTEESLDRVAEAIAREVRQVLEGDLPANLLNPEAVARYRNRFAVPAGS